jgi:hypothetical protein
MATLVHEPKAKWKGHNTSTRKGAGGVGRWRLRCDSLPDLERWLQSTPKVWGASSSTSMGREQAWDLGADWSGALEMSHKGWGKGAELVRSIASRILAKPSSERAPKWGYDVAGDIPDVGRFMAGRPDNMRRRKKTFGQSPIITICVNQSVSGGTTAEAFRNYGAALLATIDQIEASGRRVELWSGFAALLGNKRDKLGSALTRIKAADEPVDLGALAFGVAHPAFFRRLGFAILERTPADHETWGYGSCGNWTGADDLIEGPENALMIDGLGHGNDKQCANIEGALKLATDQINRAAVAQGAIAKGEHLVEMERA